MTTVPDERSGVIYAAHLASDPDVVCYIGKSVDLKQRIYVHVWHTAELFNPDV